MEKIVIFGASQYGAIAYEHLKKDYEVLGFSDNDSRKWKQEFSGLPVIGPDELEISGCEMVVIASQYYLEISRQLKDAGFPKVRIFQVLGELVDTHTRKEYFLFTPREEKLYAGLSFQKERALAIAENFSKNYAKNVELREPVDVPLASSAQERKKVLFCAYIFPPLGSSGVQRSLKFVKYLRDFGYEPIVITVGKNDQRVTQDFSLLQEVDPSIQIIRFDSPLLCLEQLTKQEEEEIFNLYAAVSLSKEWMDTYTQMIDSGELSQLNEVLLPDSKIYWVNQVLKKIEQYVPMDEISVIYTTGDPFTSYFLGYFMKHKYQIPWVADYRDPWTSNKAFAKVVSNGKTRKSIELEEGLEERLVKAADAAVVIAEKCRNDLKDSFSVEIEKTATITNGYDENDFEGIGAVKKQDIFTLCYNGVLKFERNAVDLLELINQLIDENMIFKDKIQWVFNGKIDVHYQQDLLKQDKYNIVKLNGYLPHVESVRSAMSSHLLVLFGSNKMADMCYTGKVFEYLRMQVPILSLSDKEGVLAELMEETGCGKNFGYDETSAISEYLVKQYQNWQTKVQSYTPQIQEIRKYERRYLTQKLAAVFDSLCQ